MIGIAKLSAAVLGTSTVLNGLACTPNSPAALNVLVAPGEIYSLQNIDGTAYSSLNADVLHNVVKQGLSLDTVTLSTPAPVTAGFSVNFLIQVAYSDTDANPVVLPYYNASNPAQAYSGPNNTGVAQNTVRKGVCNITIKAGTAAATGTQTTPAPDAGFVGAWVVTVANGQTTVTAPNIAVYTSAPFLNNTLVDATTIVPLSEAQTGTATLLRGWTAQRVKQAIVALAPSVTNVRETTITSSSTPTPPADTTDIYTITALAVGATIGAPTSATATLLQGQALVIRIKDNGTAQTLAWNAIYRAGTNVLPTTTIVGKTHYIGLFYNVTDTKWDVIGVPYAG